MNAMLFQQDTVLFATRWQQQAETVFLSENKKFKGFGKGEALLLFSS